MKTKLLILFLFIFLKSQAQTSFISFDQQMCPGSVGHTYTYLNYVYGTHGNGYHIYKDGVMVYDIYNVYGPLSCIDLVFINDSTGFMIEQNTIGSISVNKTTNYGYSWAGMGNGTINLLGLYMVNQNQGYLFTNSVILLITRVSDVMPQTHFYPITADTTILDTLYGQPLCPGQTHITGITSWVNDTIRDTIIFQTVITASSEEIPGNGQLTLYPNPSAEYIYLSEIAEKISSAGLYNSEGKLVRLFSVQYKSASPLYIGDLKNGLYYLKVITEKECLTRKIIKTE